MRNIIILLFLPLFVSLSSAFSPQQQPKPSTTSSSINYVPSEWYSPPPAAHNEIHNAIEFDALIRSDQISVVKFYASWCKSCQKFGLLFKRFEKQYPSSAASVEYGHHPELCRRLNIKQLPTIQFYYKGKLLKSMPASHKHFHVVEDTLQHYQQMSEAQLLATAELEEKSKFVPKIMKRVEERVEQSSSSVVVETPPSPPQTKPKWWEQFSKKK